MNSRIDEYIQYHKVSAEIQDIDPSYPLLKYICDRFELNVEQRYWLAFLYACTYNAATVFYIYNEFPDYQAVNVGRMERWWKENRDKLVFQTDCRWIRSRNQFVEVFNSYKTLVNFSSGTNFIPSMFGKEQESAFNFLKFPSKTETYDQCFKYFGNIKYFGRFRMFLYLEAIYVVTGFPIEPSGLPLETAESSRNGLCYALGLDELITGDSTKKVLSYKEMNRLSSLYNELVVEMKHKLPGIRVDAWNVETTLCAYKKFNLRKRWPGYYITRQGKEIKQMEGNVSNGVCWNVLWQFRKETYPEYLLWEITGKDNSQIDWRSL